MSVFKDNLEKYGLFEFYGDLYWCVDGGPWPTEEMYTQAKALLDSMDAWAREKHEENMAQIV